jgi:hypothetical protein
MHGAIPPVIHMSIERYAKLSEGYVFMAWNRGKFTYLYSITPANRVKSTSFLSVTGSFISVVFNIFSPRNPRDNFPPNFVPPKLLVPNSSYT